MDTVSAADAVSVADAVVSLAVEARKARWAYLALLAPKGRWDYLALLAPRGQWDYLALKALWGLPVRQHLYKVCSYSWSADEVVL